MSTDITPSEQDAAAANFPFFPEITNHPNVVFRIQNVLSFSLRPENIKLEYGWIHEPPINNIGAEVSVEHLQDPKNAIRAGSDWAVWMVGPKWTLTGGLASGIQGTMDLMGSPDGGPEIKIAWMSWDWNAFHCVLKQGSCDDTRFKVEARTHVLNSDWLVTVSSAK